MPSKPKAYSYTRYSTPEQANGDSTRRQAAAAAAWAEAREIELDTSLRMTDAGVSAFKASNMNDGAALRGFVDAIDLGVVPSGSYLLIESLDRLSRVTARKATRLLEDIVERGITVVTLSDGQEYTEERLDNDPTAMLVAFVVAWRAHDESRMKGKRVAAAWAEKRRKVRAGEAARLTRRAPGWLTPNGEGWVVVEARAEVVRRVFADTLAGRGEHSIANNLNREGVRPFGRAKQWHRSAIAKLLGNRAVLGELTPGFIRHEGGKRRRVTEDPIPGAFPAILDKETFERVRELKDGRSTAVRGRGASNPMANIISGLARCPKCGSAMTRVSKGSRSKAGQPYLVCTKAKAGAGCTYRAVKLPEVEAAILSKAAVVASDIPAGRMRPACDRELSTLESELEGAAEKLWDLAEALGASPSSTGARLLAEREADVRALERRLSETREARRLLDGGLLAARGLALLSAVEELAGDTAGAREPVNAALRVMFDRVVVDYDQQRLLFDWKHGGTSVLGYGLPSAA